MAATFVAAILDRVTIYLSDLQKFSSPTKSFEIMYDLMWITITEIWAEFEAVEREFETPAHFDSLSKENIISNRFDIF